MNKILLLIVFLLRPSPGAAAVSGADHYLSRLQSSLTQTRSNLATLTKSAEQAGPEFLAGGRLWVAGRQADFVAEACGRAGGLMAIAPLGAASSHQPRHRPLCRPRSAVGRRPENSHPMAATRCHRHPLRLAGWDVQQPLSHRHSGQCRRVVDLDGRIRGGLHTVGRHASPLPNLQLARRPCAGKKIPGEELA